MREISPIFFLICLLTTAVSVFMLTTPFYYLSLVPPLGIVLFLLLIKNPQVGYYAIVFLMPFGAYRNLWGPLASIKIHWVLAAVLLCVMALYVITRQQRSDAVSINSLWTYLVIFIGINLLAAFQSQFPATSYYTTVRLALGYLFIVLTLFFLTRNGFAKVLPRIIICSVSLSAFLAVLGFFFKISFFAADAVEGDFVRGTGGTTWATSLSITIIFTFPLLIHQFFQSRKFSSRIFWSLLAAINLAAMVTTFSRGGAIILVIILVASLYVYRHRFQSRHLGQAGFIAASLLVAALLVTPDSYWQRQKDLTKWQDASIGRRQSYLIVGWQSFLDDPFLGSGPGTFRDIYQGTQWARIFEKEGSTNRRFAHNTYVEVLVGTGISGLFFFLLIILKCLRNFSASLSMYRKRADEYMVTLVSSYRLGFVSLLLYFFLHSGLDNKYFLLAIPLSQLAVNFAQKEA